MLDQTTGSFPVSKRRKMKMLINFTCPEYNTLTGVVEVKVGNIVVRSEITEIEDGVGYYDNPHCEG